MADQGKPKLKRKISDVFKKKSKENKEVVEERVEALGAKERGEKTVEEPEEKVVENIGVQESHERKKKKFGHRRFLPSRKKNSKKQVVREDKSKGQQVGDEENLVLDKDKASQLEEEEEEVVEASSSEKNSKKQLVHGDKSDIQGRQFIDEESLGFDKDEESQLEKEKEEEEEFVEEKDNKESEVEVNHVDLIAQVQNVQLECESPEAVIQSDGKNTAAQTMVINVNDNNEQLENDASSKEKNENTEDGSLIRALLLHGLPPRGTPTHQHFHRTTGPTKSPQDEQKSDSNEIGRIIPNMLMFITNFLDMMVPGSKSNDTGTPPDTKTETIYKLVLQTADQTYSTLATLIIGVLARAGQIPKQALVNFIIYLIKKYPKCFKIKKVKRKVVLADDQSPVDTVS